MIKIVVTDFSRVLLFPKDASYPGSLNRLNNQLLADDPQYNFENYFILNEELLEYYHKLNIHIPVYVFTSETIQDHPAIKERVASSVTGVLSAKDFGLNKADSAVYTIVAKHLNVPANAILYIDDKGDNLARAHTAGMHTILFESNAQTIAGIRGTLRQESDRSDAFIVV